MSVFPRMQIESFFDKATSTFGPLLWDNATQQCAVIDSAQEHDPKSGRASTDSADSVIERVRALGLRVQSSLKTHVHADHLSADPYLQEKVGGSWRLAATSPQCKTCSASPSTPRLNSHAMAASSTGSW